MLATPKAMSLTPVFQVANCKTCPFAVKDAPRAVAVTLLTHAVGNEALV